VRRERWQQIWDLFERARRKKPEDLPGWLADTCAGDDELRREVESLLASDPSDAGLVGKIVGDAAARTFDDAATPSATAAGRRLGPFELVGELGRGGMATVYRARRVDREFEQEVAIKVARGGLAAPELERRFLAERQILASLDHPAIARLIDGGTATDGTAWVAMELVEGIPIDRYCDREHLPERRRVELMISVCNAVHHAHRNLVVHRDLKPGNVLVTREGAPKLLDFGIAKLLGGASQLGVAENTRTEHRVFTPAYASPEQIRGEPITTASDVYSLGVMLFQLLTGRRPFEESEAPTPTDLERRILEVEPAVPRSVPADLARIVHMALRKEPARRYASAEQLATDLRRYLDGQPVIAQDDTWTYRTVRFVGRHRWAVAAAAVFAVVLAGFAVSTLIQSRTLRVERDRALLAEERARIEAETAAEVSEFLIDLFQVADPAEAKGEEIRAREILDAGVERVERELAASPEIRARLMSTMGRVYTNLGLHREARPLLMRSLEDRRALVPADDLAVAESLENLGELDKFQGRIEDASANLERALGLRRGAGDEGSEAWIRSLLRLGNLRFEEGRFEEAEAIAREVLAAARGTLGDEHETVGDALNGLGQVLTKKGALAEAETVLRDAATHNERARGANDPSVSDALHNLALALGMTGRGAEAAEVQRRVLEINRVIYGGRHSRVALAQNNLALTLKELGQFEEAERIQRQSMELFIEIFGEEHPQVAMTWVNLANLRQSVGDLEEAESYQRRALALNRRLLGGEHPEVATGIANLANLLYDKGDLDGSERYYREALDLDRRTLDPGHPYIALDLNNIGRVKLERGEYDEAEELIREAIDVATRSLGAEHATTAEYLASLGAVCTRTGRLEEADELLTRALDNQRSGLPEGHWRIDQTRAILAACRAAQGRVEEARSMLRESLENLRAKLGPRSGATLRAEKALAELPPEQTR
jgi:serine/threonine-protein kinase